MATTHQYEAIGRLALTFNEVDFMIEGHTTFLLATPEDNVALELAKQGTFRNKLQRLKTVLNEIGARRPTLQPYIEAVLKLKPEIERLAERRNEFIHALVTEDVHTKAPGLLVKGAQRPFDEAEINDLTARAQDLTDRLNDACAGLIVELDEQRVNG